MSDRAALLEIKAGLLRSLAAVNAELGIESDYIDKSFTLNDLEDPIPCEYVATVLRRQTASVNRTLRSAGLPVVKVGGRTYCQRINVEVIWPGFKKKWRDY